MAGSWLLVSATTELLSQNCSCGPRLLAPGPDPSQVTRHAGSHIYMENVRQVRSMAILHLLPLSPPRRNQTWELRSMVFSCYSLQEIRFLHIFSSPVQHFIFQQRRRWASCQLPDADTRPGNRFHAPMFVYILNVNTEQSGDGDWDNLEHDGMPSDKRTFFLCSPGHGN